MNVPTDIDVLAELRRARPEPPADALSPESGPARLLLRRVVSEPRPRPRRVRPHLITLAAAATAAAAIGVLIALPNGNDDPAAGTVGTPPPPTAAAAEDATSAIIDPAGPHTATATLSVGGHSERLMLDGENVSSSTWSSPTRETPGGWIENRRVDGVIYLYMPDQDGERFWSYDPDDYTTLSEHPTGNTPFELHGALTDDSDFEPVGEEEIDGIPVTHVRAVSPHEIDSATLPLAGHGWSEPTVETLELWVTENDVVLRVEATLIAPEPNPETGPDGTLTYDLEFHDVGNNAISVDVPPGAVELDGVG